ncbi:MAG: glycoside hydrolase family 88 protein [Terracidiphilus sp.]
MQLPETSRTGLGSCLSIRARRNLRYRAILVAALAYAVLPIKAQTKSWSVRIADVLIAHSPEDKNAGGQTNLWNEGTGLELEALDAVWYNTAKGDYFRYVQRTVDAVLRAREAAADGGQSLTAFKDPFLARQLLLLSRVTLAPRYYQAASAMQHQLAQSCVLPSASSVPVHGNEGLARTPCKSQPFLAEYASVFHQPEDFPVITRSLDQWDERINRSSRRLKAAVTSEDFAERAFLALALVDSLPNYPRDDPGRAELLGRLNRMAAAIVQRQNRQTGLFRETPAAEDLARHSDSFSISCLLVYALDRGVRLGYLPESYAASAQRAWQGILKYAVQVDASGAATLRPDLPSMPPDNRGYSKELGPLLLAATESDLASNASLARGETVMLDAWYNSQQRKNAAGQLDYFHYKWSDWSDSGYSLFGQMFRSYGVTTETLYSAPTRENLSKSQFYIIVSPDIPVKNPNLHYLTEQDAGEVAAWVKQGGILVLMENDPPNADITHLNLLADRFGIHFDDVLHHHIIGEHVEDGRIPISADEPLFHHPHTLYMKDTCAISLRESAVPLLRDRGDVVMATAKYGRGTVFAAVDPWLYNEYTDGRKNPAIYDQFDNFAGGEEFVQWLLQQHPR